jgi:hypothetical protein
VVKLRLEMRFIIVRFGVRAWRRKNADDASRSERRNGTATLGCNILWCGMGS